jgi:thymidylate synthase (FAD)
MVKRYFPGETFAPCNQHNSSQWQKRPWKIKNAVEKHFTDTEKFFPKQNQLKGSNMINDNISVLDHGSIRLVDHMGGDLSIVRAARVSYNADWRTGEDEGKDAKLIHYLMKNRHTSPFESVTFTFEVKAPIFVFRQWHRHRTQSYSELSARYSELPDEMYIPDINLIGKQALHNKQVRTLGELEIPERMKLEQSLFLYETHMKQCYAVYQSLLNTYQWPRELARAVLPFALYSKMFTTLNLHNLFHFIGLRLHPHAQHEIRVYADAMLKLIQPIVPIAVKAYLENNPCS